MRCKPGALRIWIARGNFPQGVSMAGGHPLWPTEAIKGHIKARCIEHGYSEAQVAEIFSRANLAMPPEQSDVTRRLDQLTRAIEQFVAAHRSARSRPHLSAIDGRLAGAGEAVKPVQVINSAGEIEFIDCLNNSADSITSAGPQYNVTWG